jgi:hypothetical protein
VNFSGSYVQPQRDVVESAVTDPPDAFLDRMQYGEKTMSLTVIVAVERCTRIRGSPLATLPD